MEYIKSIALFLVFITFIENVVALGNMKKYIKLFCGIIVIFILLQPISAILGEDFDIESILELNELKYQLEDINEQIDNEDTIIGKIEENIGEIVSLQGYELTYLLIVPDENNEEAIGGISITIKEKKSNINIEKINVSDEKKENQVVKPSVTKISEEIAKVYNINQNEVIVNVE